MSVNRLNPYRAARVSKWFLSVGTPGIFHTHQDTESHHYDDPHPDPGGRNTHEMCSERQTDDQNRESCHV